MDRNNLSNAEVFMALYNRARPHGNSFMAYVPKSMTLDEAAAAIASMGNTYVDYFKGRVMKIDIGKKFLETQLYNRDNGPGAAEDALLDYMTAPKK